MISLVSVLVPSITNIKLVRLSTRRILASVTVHLPIVGARDELATDNAKQKS